MGQKTKVVFLHRAGLSGAGSKIMRCDQLSELCRPYLDDEFEFSVVAQRPMRSPVAIRRRCVEFSGCIVIMLKGTAALFGDYGMERLRRNARAVCIDYVDGNIQGSFSQYADVHIGASMRGCQMLQNFVDEYDGSQGVVMPLTHHADPRLAGLRCRQYPNVRPVYLGHPANVLMPGQVRDRVHLLEYDRDINIADTFDALCGFNLHYAVRPNRAEGQESAVAKPFTKGFTAAALGAMVMTARDTDDAVYYLGEDFPFLLDSLDEPDILAALDRADSLFGTPDWAAAEERMEFVRARSSPAWVAKEMREILTSLT